MQIPVIATNAVPMAGIYINQLTVLNPVSAMPIQIKADIIAKIMRIGQASFEDVSIVKLLFMRSIKTCNLSLRDCKLERIPSKLEFHRDLPKIMNSFTRQALDYLAEGIPPRLFL